jgi:hypothetical protein
VCSGHAGCFNAVVSTGSLRKRLPVATKITVDHCGDDWRGPGLAHSARRLETLDDVDLDGRRLVHAQHRVSIEIGLLDALAFEGDLAIGARVAIFTPGG